MNYNEFKFYTKTLKAVKKDNARYIVGIASSTSLDRDGDRMSEAALQTMKATAEANLTIFTNHEYKVPDDLFGSCVEANIKARKDESPIVVKSEDDSVEIATFSPQEMEIKIKVVSDAVNPKAGQLYKAIEEGVALGFSIGGVVKKSLLVLDDVTKNTYNLIDAIALYEISIVSIPSNPDAMNLAIAKSLKAEKSEKVDNKEIVEIIKGIEESKKEPEYTMEGVQKFLVEQLKKDYDEAISSEGPESDEKWEHESMQRAKASAENVLMKAGKEAKVANTDCHKIHLESHAWVMDYLLSSGKDVTLFAAHIEDHLSKLKKQLADEAAEEKEEESVMPRIM